MSRDSAPTGTVTFLFTDIEGSTRLWDQHPDAMSQALSQHDALLQRTVDEGDGYVFSQAGDGWGVSFSSPAAALDTALKVQSLMASETWPTPIDSLKVRMGLHTGTSEERGGDYFGTTVNRAARVSAVGSGGQVLVTDAVRTLVADDAPTDWRFRDLGEHRLRDLVRAERIWQLDTSDAPALLADLGTRASRGNLPVARTHVIGRESDVVEVVDLIRHDPLVTLVGVGGVGKTTLAQTVARTLADDYPAGAWFVDLSGVEDPDSIPAAVASSLDIAQRPGMTTIESLADALRADRRLVIIDNAEHQIDAVADLADTMLMSISDVSLIVTSREALAIEGEAIHRVGPLTVDDSDEQSPAVTLFIERARRVAPDLLPHEFDLAPVSEICRRLDGLPLAIELAASQCETMTPSEIATALASDELALRSGSRSTAARHRSLFETVRWSYELLEPVDQVVFDRLSIFRGGCTAEAARSVCSDSEVSERQVAASIRTLVRKSMVVADRRGETTRLQQLETLRRFAEERLAERGEIGAIAERHALWFGRLSADGGDGMAGPDEARHVAALLDDLDNLRAALHWAGERRRFEVMGQLGASLPYLMGSKMRPEMAGWISDALEVLPPDNPARIDYAHAAGHSTMFRGDLDAAPRVFAEATTGLGDNPQVDLLHRYLILVTAFFGGDVDRVIDDSADAMVEAYALDFGRVGAAIGADLALALLFSGDEAAARQIAGEVTAYGDESGNPSILAWARYAEGEIEADSDPVAAIEHLEEAVEFGVTVGNEFIAGIALIALAATAGRQGDFATALDGMERCLPLWRAAGNRPQMWTAVRNLVEMLHAMNMNVDALTLHAAVEADAEHASELFGPYGDRYRSIIGRITADLGPDEAAVASGTGRALGYSEAAGFALEAIDRARDTGRN